MSEILEEKLLMLIKEFHKEKANLEIQNQSILNNYSLVLNQFKTLNKSIESLELNAKNLTLISDKLITVKFPEKVQGFITHNHQIKEGKWWLYISLMLFGITIVLFSINTWKYNRIDEIYIKAKRVDSLKQLKLTAAENSWLMEYKVYINEKSPKTSLKYIKEHPYPKNENN